MKSRYFLLFFPVSSGTAFGAVLANYEFTGGSLRSSDVEPGSVAGPLTLGPGFPDSFGKSISGGSSRSGILGAGEAAADSLWAWQGDHGTTGFANARSGGYFIGFTLTAAPGSLLSLSSLTFDHRGTSSNQTWTVSVTTSLDNHANHIAQFEGKDFGFTRRTVNLQSLESRSELEFRLYLSVDKQTGNAPDRGQGFDNIRASGSFLDPSGGIHDAHGAGSPIPEPGGSMVGLAVAAGLIFRRTGRQET